MNSDQSHLALNSDLSLFHVGMDDPYQHLFQQPVKDHPLQLLTKYHRLQSTCLFGIIPCNSGHI